MKFSQYLDCTRKVPRPTEEQWSCFAEHVAVAHSWYKHLSLLHGADFIVFLDPKAGAGFTGEHPRLHHTWKNTGEYREKFGFLSYMWRPREIPDAQFMTDYGFNGIVVPKHGEFQLVELNTTALPELPAEIVSACGFVLYPYVNVKSFLQIAYSNSCHSRALDEIVAGHPHPGRRELLLLSQPCLVTMAFDYVTEQRPVWEAIWTNDQRRTFLGPDAERDALCWAKDQEQFTPRQREFAHRLWRHQRRVTWLELPERRKIARALQNLRNITGA